MIKKSRLVPSKTDQPAASFSQTQQDWGALLDRKKPARTDKKDRMNSFAALPNGPGGTCSSLNSTLHPSGSKSVKRDKEGGSLSRSRPTQAEPGHLRGKEEEGSFEREQHSSGKKGESLFVKRGRKRPQGEKQLVERASKDVRITTSVHRRKPKQRGAGKNARNQKRQEMLSAASKEEESVQLSSKDDETSQPAESSGRRRPGLGRPLTDLGLLPSSFNIANSSYSEEEFEAADEEQPNEEGPF